MKTYTLGFLFKGDKIILAKKKRKFGVGKWNGYGGKVEEGEDNLKSLTREIEEECGVVVSPEDCIELGLVDFTFLGNDEKGQKVYIYRINKFVGDPSETDEMSDPMEFDFKDVPYKEMLLGDDAFVPFVIAGKKFKGEMLYSEDGEKLLECKVDEEKINEIKSEISPFKKNKLS